MRARGRPILVAILIVAFAAQAEADPSSAGRAPKFATVSANPKGAVHRLQARVRRLRNQVLSSGRAPPGTSSRSQPFKDFLPLESPSATQLVRRAADFKAKLDAIPSPLKRGRRDGAAGGGLQPADTIRAGVAGSREALIAHAAMSYVVGHVSAPAYGYMNGIQGVRPTPTGDGVLRAGAGICGHAALTFAAIVKRFGCQCAASSSTTARATIT